MSIVDGIAAVFLVIGAGLAALGAIGLLRFPDVLTRMHAATKVASVGVIAITVAAAFEAGALGGILVLGLVVALLFLSGPLGMSLLARSAYHDPETPLSPNTRRLALSIPPRTPATRERRLVTRPLLAVWLFGVWVALFGSAAPNILAGGVIVAAAVSFLFRRLAPRWPRALAHPVAAARFASFFMVQLAVSTWRVVVALWHPPDRLRPAVIEVPLRVRTRTEVTLLMNSISFTPGTVALEQLDERLLVHVLDTEDPAVEVAGIQGMETRIMEMFGTEVGRRQ